MTVFNAQRDVAQYARMVPVAEIPNPANAYNLLSIPCYIDTGDPEDVHDLAAHLNGGIPEGEIVALERYWVVFPTLRQVLFESRGRPGYSDVRVEEQREEV